MSALFENLAEIIRSSSSNSLSLIALMVIAISIISFFGNYILDKGYLHYPKMLSFLRKSRRMPRPLAGDRPIRVISLLDF